MSDRRPTARQKRTVAASRAALGDPAFSAMWAEGRAMLLEQAVEFALEEVGRE